MTQKNKAGRSADDKEIYPCDDCGKMRSKNQGGTVFTVCDKCWDKHYNSTLNPNNTLTGGGEE